MCGIAGYAKMPEAQTKSQLRAIRKISKSLLNSIAERGKDSTGIAMMSETREPTIYKTLTSSDKLVKSLSYSKIANHHRGDTTICLMHTRFSTMDRNDIRQNDAHPFSIGNTIGMHNGIIYNHDELDKKHAGKYRVDSQYLLHYINQEDDIQNALDEIVGDYAVSWVKNSNSVLNLLHEGGRDLAMLYWKEAKVLFFASRIEYLKSAVSKYRINSKPYEAKIDTHYVYDVYKFSDTSSNVTKTLVDSNRNGDQYGYGFNYGSCSYIPSSIDMVTCVECKQKVDKFDVIKEDDKYTCLDCEFITKGLDEKVLDYGMSCEFCSDMQDVVHRHQNHYYCDYCLEFTQQEERDYVYEQHRIFN